MKLTRKVFAILLSLTFAGSAVLPSFAEDNTTDTETAQVSTQAVRTVEGDGTIADLTTTWRYLDDRTDPANGASDRLVWTQESYDDSAWKSASGTFGSKRGTANFSGNYVAQNILAGCDGSDDTPAYFFRTQFTLDQAAKYDTIEGSLLYDDGAILYINGVKVAASAEMDGYTGGNQDYAGDNAGGDPRTIAIAAKDLSMLHDGTNTIAVEVHNGRPSSSDVWFSLPSLKLTAAAGRGITQSSIELAVGASETEMGFNWYADVQSKAGVILGKYEDIQAVVDAGAGEQGLVDAVQAGKLQWYQADVTEAGNKPGYYSCKASASGLSANTKYGYVLGNYTDADSKISDLYSFITDGDGEFSFAYAGDPQIGAGHYDSDVEGWDNTLNLLAANETFQGLAFLFSAGDQVNVANNEQQYDGYLEHDALPGIPMATTVGNHDSKSAAYSEHFNVPNVSSYGATTAGSDYYSVYDHVLFLVLNSNNRSTAEHKAFMEQAIEATKDQGITWKIAEFHHSTYSVANHAVEADILQRREELSPVFKDLDIDVVLMGHDHVYCRTYMMDGTTPMTDASIYDDAEYSSITDPTGILYVTANSASGSKFYNIQNLDFPYARVMTQEYTPNISKVTISDKKFNITTYRTQDMSVVDTFTIYRSSKLTAAESAGGTVTADKENAKEGETVTLTAVPAEGHVFTSWKVTDADGNEIPVNEDGTFTMPAGDVTYGALFQADYKITKGNGQVIVKPVDGDAEFEANGAYDQCIGIKIDGKDLTANQFTLAQGSTKVALHKDYVNTLTAGDHTIDVVYPDGQASGSFKITETKKPEEPVKPAKNNGSSKGTNTGVNTHSELWITLMIAGMAALFGMLVWKKRNSL